MITGVGRHAASLALAEEEREQLAAWSRGPGRRAARAQIVLACAEPGAVNERVAAELGVTTVTVGKWRRRFAEAGLADGERPGWPKAGMTLTDDERDQLTRWARRANSAQALALRSKIVLACARTSASWRCGAGCARAARRGRGAGAGRRRVLVLGVYSVEVAAAPGRGGGRRARGRRERAGRRCGCAGLAEFMVSGYSDAGQERWLAGRGIDLLRGTGRLAGAGVVDVGGVRRSAGPVVVATGSDPVVPAMPGLGELESVWGAGEATSIRLCRAACWCWRVRGRRGCAGGAASGWRGGARRGRRPVLPASLRRWARPCAGTGSS